MTLTAPTRGFWGMRMYIMLSRLSDGRPPIEDLESLDGNGKDNVVRCSVLPVASFW